jgi:hypothetical protein
MVSRLVESQGGPLAAITGVHLVPQVGAGAHFENGTLVERPEAAA